jgi:hypothetical protein
MDLLFLLRRDRIISWRGELIIGFGRKVSHVISILVEC